jgi:signal transduction histidine kinase
MSDFPLAELQAVPEFQDLPEEAYAWLAENARVVPLAVGDRVFGVGKPAEEMYVVLEGAIQLLLDVGGQPVLYDTFRARRIFGVLPYSRMTTYTGVGVVIEPGRLLEVQRRDFPGLLATSEELGRRLIGNMSDRVRESTRAEQQREKLAALGKLSAGLAHELNNPAAAIRRSVADLLGRVARLPELVAQMTEHRVTAEQVRLATELRAGVVGEDSEALGVLGRADREDALSDRLEALAVPEASALAGTLADAGFDEGCLASLAADVPPEALPDVLAWLDATLAADRLLAEVASAAARISELLASVKTYSHMDQAPVLEPTDVRRGIESTLVMLNHAVRKKGVRVERDFPSGLPAVAAYTGELNQVWTNLLDNALDAVPEGGRVSVRAREEGRYLRVDVEDDGPGIPEALRHRVFEPFFTTKGVGEGTGLGLDVVRRIVEARHGGAVSVESRPGRTVFTVRLPLSGAVPEPLAEGSRQ